MQTSTPEPVLIDEIFKRMNDIENFTENGDVSASPMKINSEITEQLNIKKGITSSDSKPNSPSRKTT